MKAFHFALVIVVMVATFHCLYVHAQAPKMPMPSMDGGDAHAKSMNKQMGMMRNMMGPANMNNDKLKPVKPFFMSSKSAKAKNNVADSDGDVDNKDSNEDEKSDENDKKVENGDSDVMKTLTGLFG